MKIFRTKQEVLEFVESLSPDEAADVLEQLASFNEEEMEGFGVELGDNGRWIVKLVPKSKGTMQ